MALKGYFFNAIKNSQGKYDREYNVEDFCSYLNQLVGNGVFPYPSEAQLKVRASDGMNIIVGAGLGWVQGHKVENTSDMVLTVPESDVVMDRIDRVVFGVDWDTREPFIEVKKGTIAAEPVPPALTRNDHRYELGLAEIRVNKQIKAIDATMITDTRMISEVCGWVQGLLQQVSTTSLFEQWEAQFNEWFEDAKEQFQAGKQFKKYEGIHVTEQPNEASWNVADIVPHYAYQYDILEVYINGIHLTGNEYTITNSTVTLETPIEEAGAVVDFVVYKTIDK